jgi:hypothetical protein
VADYQARINLLVTGQNRLRDVQTQLQAIEQTITDLERRQRVAGAAASRTSTIARAIGGTAQPRGQGGRFVADPDRQQRFAVLAAQRRLDVETRLARLLTSRARDEADSINTRITGQNRVNRRIEAQITLESRLNSAVDLYRTNLQKFERAGGANNATLNRQVTTIRDAFAAFEAGGSRNLRLVRSLATELGRVGEAQRELNRSSSLSSKGFEAGRRIQERLTTVSERGVTDPAQIRSARSLATEAIAASRTGDQQAYSNAIRRATAATARLERESRETAQTLNDNQKALRDQTKAAVSLAKQKQKALDNERKGRGQRLESLALGVGFPLLFGGGPGSVLGGAAGSFLGSGFGGQIILSAIGAQFDAIAGEIAKTGVALTSTSGTLELMREKALFSSTAVEDQAIALEEQGKVTELANLLTQDLAKSIGGEGVRALQALGDETNILTKEWNLLTAQLFALVAGPLAAFINALNTVLGGITTENRLNTLRNEATPAQQKRLAEITAEERGGKFELKRGGGQAFIAGPETTQVRQEILKRATAEGIVPVAPPGRVTSEDRRTITAPTNGASGKAARDAEREAERVAELVRSQALVTAELKRQEEFSAKIFAAELAKDPMLARRLKGEQQLVEWGYETANLLEKEESAAGRLALARKQQAKQALILQKTTQDLVKLENDRVESANKDIAALENELKIKNALTQVERDRLRIEYEMQVLSDSKKFDQDQLNRIEDLKKQIAAPALGADLIRQQIGTLSDEILKLTDGGNIAITVANGIGSAFSTSFKGIIDGSMSAKEALASFFTSVADMFLDMAAQIIAKMITMAILNQILGVLPGIGGAGSGTLALSSNPNVGAYMGGGGIEGITMDTFGGFKANGGPVSSGQTYMVGERGPELFVPGRSGTIVANDKMGGGSTNVVVNVDAKGSSVEGNEQGANQLGRVISAAVQSELIKQQRPGGILAR